MRTKTREPRRGWVGTLPWSLSIALLKQVGARGADVGEAERLELAQNLLDSDLGPLGAGAQDFCEASARTTFRCRHP
jgi:hypothetical protein